jgi:hypothetical protein
MNDAEKIQKALETIRNLAGFDGDHHKAYAFDQVVRVLTDCPTVIRHAVDVNKTPYSYEDLAESEEYIQWVRDYEDGEDGPHTYEWDTGIGP